jgi:hypothetical protein
MELARQHGMASKYYLGFGVDGVEEMVKLCREVHAEFPHVVFFASKLVFENERGSRGRCTTKSSTQSSGGSNSKACRWSFCPCRRPPNDGQVPPSVLV